MNIRNYQVHNVLKVYQRQLRHGLTDLKQRRVSGFLISTKPCFTGNRQNIIDKVKSEVLKKTNHFETMKKSTMTLQLWSTD